ncbi:copper chaperone PCu(A)C [Ottowia sp. SB7-C50]|uniref:copper chaperone PCu(A)C n=1 Tax=Ottowia sp. SB7-C50 TaxID=3081231 RepID=UPI0029540A93|nr:copper chaperone PCu(A)C [Ottowia sp. SB7-C50]WOP15230.1 copper chaperone PCu(A)C [Ottowia sp. SB7-C50]
MQRMTLTLAALVLASASASAHAQVTVSDAWVRGTVPQQKATGAFMHIAAEQDVRLIAGASPVAGVVEIHEMAMEGNVMKMRELKGGLPIAKGATAELKPGGYHVMLMDLKQTLKGGETVPVTLTFEDAVSKKTFTRELMAPVKALGGATSGPHSGQHKH